ncbi:MAG: response regulator transcription factor [Ignavibacteria bacterium]|nr:response regulator transcription factor [Ignavibacteria bacterium]
MSLSANERLHAGATGTAHIRAIIVDDEQPCRETLLRHLARHCPHLHVLAQCASVAEALEAIGACDPDLVFLDIMLPDGTGFDVLQCLDRVAFKVIFTTAHDEFAIRAIRFSALDYLLKPVLVGELLAAVEKVSQPRIPAHTSPTQIRLLRENLAHGGNNEMQMALPTLDGFMFVAVHDMVSCEARSNYTECGMANGEALTVCRTLKEFEDLLGDRGFFRIHHSHMINLRHLRRYVRGKGGYVVMSSGKEFEVSVRRKDAFITALGMT